MDEPAESSWENYRPPVPDTSHLITETEEAVDNLFSEKQMRLLTEPLYSSWNPGRPFWVAANVNTDGGEPDRKLARYAKLHVDHYVIFDPLACLSAEPLQAYVLLAGAYEKRPQAEAFPTVAGLQLQLWEGAYEGQTERWLRWAREPGEVIPTGAELAKGEAQRANVEAQRANAEASHAQAETKRANEEAARADAESERARVEAARADALAARLRELGIDPQ